MRRFKTDTIEIKDEFFQRKLPELLPERADTIAPGDLIAAFLTVNRDKREQAEEVKRALAAKTQPRTLALAGGPLLVAPHRLLCPAATRPEPALTGG